MAQLETHDAQAGSAKTSPQHTPGPWFVRPHEYDDWGWVKSAEGKLVAVARAGRSVTDEELSEHRRAGTDPYGANAHLIAAAPDLLALILDLVFVLEVTDTCLRSWNGNQGSPADVPGVLAAARTVALKATGGNDA